ncbi:MAG: hypothetical protein AAGH99_12825 [Planctomycetota bacterium]
MQRVTLEQLTQQNRRLKLALAGLAGLVVLVFASGQVIAPKTSEPEEYRLAVPVEKSGGYIVLLRNDGKFVRVTSSGSAEVFTVKDKYDN